MSYLTVVRRDEDTAGLACYLAWNPELTGCMARGDTVDDAIANLDDARELVMDYMTEIGMTIPNPQTIAGAVIDFAGPGA